MDSRTYQGKGNDALSGDKAPGGGGVYNTNYLRCRCNPEQIFSQSISLANRIPTAMSNLANTTLIKALNSYQQHLRVMRFTYWPNYNPIRANQFLQFPPPRQARV